MRPIRGWRRTALLLALLAVVATACRGGGETADEPADDAAATTAEEEPTDDDAADDGATQEPGDTAGTDVVFDVGVTEEACPDAVNPDNGCIFLGVLSDLTVGPFAPLAVPITQAQEAFWGRVNEQGGIGGFDVNISEFTRDNEYNPEVHSQQYEEIKDDVLALAQTLGSPTTAAIIDDLNAEGIVAAPASWTSGWLYEDVILESGNTYCIESMNAVDWALENLDGPIENVMAVHFPGDYGDDGAAGAQIAAEANGLEFIDVQTTPGQDNQAEAISAVATTNPDLVIITTAPTEVATVLGQAAAQGFDGTMIATSPGWNKALLDSPAAPAIQAQLFVSYPWREFDSDTPGHQAMRDAVGDVDPNDGFTAGWAWSYPLLAVLEQAAANGDLTRQGLLDAVGQTTEVDYEGMLPVGAGNLAGEPNEAAVRQTVIAQPDPDAAVGVRNVQDFFTGPTAEAYEFTEPCFNLLG